MSNYLTDYLLRAKTSVSLTRDLLLEIFATHGRHFIIAESKTLLKSQFYIPAKIYICTTTYLCNAFLISKVQGCFNECKLGRRARFSGFCGEDQ